MLFPVYRPGGGTTTVFRPDRPYKHDPGWKYEQVPKDNGGGNVLDVHPYCQAYIGDPDVPVIFVEGTKKADAVVTAFRAAGLRAVVVAIVGVWNWLHEGGQVIPDMYDIPLQGRRATVMFDSDVLSKWQVQLAAKRLADHLTERGADVHVTYFADQPDGAKMGADDFFAQGGTLPELRLLTRRYDPADFVNVRLTRDEGLRAMLADLQRTYEAMPCAKHGEFSDRATMRAALPRAATHGKPVEGGIEVRLPLRPLCKQTRLSVEAQRKSLKRLERGGYLERVAEPKHKTDDKGAAYLLKALTCGSRGAEGRHYEREAPQEGREGQIPHRYTDSYAGVYPARSPYGTVPELRYAKCRHTWARRAGRRVVVDSQYVYRLAKPRQEIVMYLLEHGGEAAEAELLDRFGSRTTRLRDFRKRRIAPLTGTRYSRDKGTGREVELEVGPPLVTNEGGTVRLLPEWREALEQHRRETGELVDNRRQEQRMDKAAKAWRERDRSPADQQPYPLRGKDHMQQVIKDQEAERHWIEEQRRKVGTTAAVFLSDEMADVVGVRFADVRERWARHGGKASDLARAVRYGPYTFKREADGDLYVEHEDGRTEDAYDRKVAAKMREQGRKDQPRPARRKAPTEVPLVGGVHQHGPDCDCDWCAA